VIPAAALDRAILRILDALEASGPEREDAEALLRLGATRGRQINVTHAAASRFGVHRVRVAERMRRSGLPNPKDLLAWGRLTSAAAAWRPREDGRRRAPRPLRRVAEGFGWCNGQNVSAAFRRQTGTTLSAWYAEGGTLDDLGNLFVRTWRERTREEVAA